MRIWPCVVYLSVFRLVPNSLGLVSVVGPQVRLLSFGVSGGPSYQLIWGS